MSSSRQFAQHVRVSSTDELSYSSSAKGEINDTIHTIVTGRKCWKTMKGKGEVVWPPYLEAALVEGLEKYQPVESRTTRAFGRFPMRNKFISDYIYNATGKRRTPKQVGSRLQQLRDTAEGKRILQLLSSRHIAMMQPSKADAHRDTAPARTPEPAPAASPASSSSTPAPSRPPCTYVAIDVTLDSSGAPAALSTSPLVPTAGAGPSSFHTAGARPLRAIDPTITFVSRTPLSGYAAFRVARGARTVHTERTPLELLSSHCVPAPVWPSQMECQFLYRTPFVPGFWAHLCECGDPTPYTIVQDVVRTSSPAPPAGPAAEEVLLSVVYQFNVPSSPPLSPASSSGSTAIDADSAPFTAESSPELGSDFDDFLMLGSFDAAPHPHAGRAPAYAPSPDLTPGLIHRDEDGYASLPPSPLDMSFPPVHDVPRAPAPALCGSYAPFAAAPCYDQQYHSFSPSFATV
ncbi:hypothetical protein AcV5_003826 [Taiwanofungus camphoratus]|nr:hypothetical protein AcV5_003826 [Antrodia cinnamomea]